MPGAKPELTLVRWLPAPPALVFRAWTDQEHAARWWGPKGFTAVSCAIEPRLGGRFRIAMRAPSGEVHCKQGEFLIFDPPGRLSFTFAWEDAAGQPGHEMRIALTLSSEGTGTRLTLQQTRFATAALRDSHREGWTSTLERLAASFT